MIYRKDHKAKASNVSGILFDKDGTLFEFDAVWSVWCDRVLSSLSGGDNGLAQELATLIGYDLHGKNFKPGSLIVSGAADDTVKALSEILPGIGLEEINRVCTKSLDNIPLAPVNNLVNVLDSLKLAGYKLGVATNDTEQSALSQLCDSKVDHLFDFTCGFDSGFGSKPQPGMLEAFCTTTELAPSEIAMVGDSLHDINAGIAHGVQLTIGVLTGPASRSELECCADIVIEDISLLPALFAGI